MVKFTVLELNRKIMIRAGLLLNESTNGFFKSINTYFILFFIIGYFVSAATFVIEVATQYADIMDLCFVAVGAFQSFGMYINVGLQMRKIETLLIKLQKIVDEGNLWKIFSIGETDEFSAN